MNDELPLQSDLLRGPQISDDVLRDLPKADLHVHLDGSLRIETFEALCQQQGVELPGGSQGSALKQFRHRGTQEEYANLVDVTDAVLQDTASLRRVAAELVEDCAAENVWHVEIRFTPTSHTRGGLSPEAATEAVLEGLAEATARGETTAGLLIAGVRDRDPQETVELAKLAVAFKDRGVTGFDLAGAEAYNPAKEHREAFYIIQNNNLNITVHAGEGWGADSIAQALHYLSANRIGHGTHLEDDLDLRDYVADHRIPVEVGLYSSVRAGAVPNLTSHPLRRFLKSGIRVALCTNNRLFLGNSMTQELRVAADTFDLSLLEVENMLVAGFKSAFLPQAEKVERIRAALAEFANVRVRHGLEGV